MSRFGLCLLVFLYAASLLDAQTPQPADGGAVPVGPGVTAPRIRRKVEPEYSPEALSQHIQGTVVLQITVDENGRAADVTVISPLGFGLDEAALAAVEQWEFTPGMKDGKPVKVMATIQVNFRFPTVGFDEKGEQQRTSFNTALQILRRPDASPGSIDKGVKTMQDLARHHFGPAMFLVGGWELSGEHQVTKDPADGLALIQNSADKNYGPALYDIAARLMDGRTLPQDTEKGLKMMRQASVLGSRSAQFDLGNRYETAKGVERDTDRARRYFRLCAAQGVPECEFRLARLLFNASGRPERDYIQAVAWFQLAGEQGIAEGKEIASREVAAMTPEQTRWMNSLKAQLVRK